MASTSAVRLKPKREPTLAPPTLRFECDSDGKRQISWSAIDNATGYVVELADNTSPLVFTEIARCNARETVLELEDLDDKLLYTAKVHAVNSSTLEIGDCSYIKFALPEVTRSKTQPHEAEVIDLVSDSSAEGSNLHNNSSLAEGVDGIFEIPSSPDSSPPHKIVKAELDSPSESPSANESTAEPKHSASTFSGLPVYAETEKWLFSGKDSWTDATRALLSLHSSNQPMCSTIPKYVNKSLAFAVDARGGLDLATDNLQPWKNNRTDVIGFAVSTSTSGKTVINYVGKLDETTKSSRSHKFSHILKQQKHFHKHSPDVHKRIISLSVSSRPDEPFVAIIQYVFKEGPKDLAPQPHGNSITNTRPHFKTSACVKKAVIDNAGKFHGSAKRIAAVVKKEAGGFEAPSLAELPKDRKQVQHWLSGVKHKTKSLDPWNDLVAAAAEEKEKKDGLFIREIKAIMFTDRQLKDIISWGPQGTIIGVDVKFNVGPFYVLVVQYTHPYLLHRRTQQEPVLLGPVSIVHTKKLVDYLGLFETMRTHAYAFANDGLDGIRAVGKDGELNLSKCLTHCFPNASQLLCYVHFRKNVERKMIELGVQQSTRTLITNDIKKLVRSSYEKFDDNFEKFAEKLVSIKGQEVALQGLLSYLRKEKLNEMKEEVLVCHHQKFKPSTDEPYTQNGIESLNNIIGQWLRDKQDVSGFYHNIKVHTSAQKSTTTVFASGPSSLTEHAHASATNFKSRMTSTNTRAQSSFSNFGGAANETSKYPWRLDSPHPWTVVSLHETQAKVCGGCRCNFADSVPENGIILKRTELDFKGTKELVQSPRHFHARPYCLLLRHGAAFKLDFSKISWSRSSLSFKNDVLEGLSALNG